MGAVENGARVRVREFEATVAYDNGDGRFDLTYFDPTTMRDRTIEYVPSDLIEFPAEPLKVGDTIEWCSDIEEPPVGTTLRYENGGEIISRTDRGWQFVGLDSAYEWTHTNHSTRTVLYVPEVTA